MLIRTLTAIAALVVLTGSAVAQEAVIRKNLVERLPTLPKIDEVKLSSMPGLWEIRIGTEIRYTDAQGNYLIEGELIDLRSKRNLTEERVNKLTAIDFASLPLKDAIVWKTGTGKRRIAVFADPNCGYCKRFERALLEMKDITVYTFVVPILGGDSPEKSRAIWCAKEQQVTWRNWMLEGTAPPKVASACDESAIERNNALIRKHRINGTPAIVFEDGQRVPGALTAEQLEKRLQTQAVRS
nr:DsbC family protein [uncultured Roseateles sp.]